MKPRYQVIVGVAVVALGTWLAGWLVPVAWGVIAGMLWWGARPARAAAMASALAWGLLLIMLSLAGYPIPVLASRLGGALGVSAPVLIAVTVLYAALLSGTAAYLAAALQGARRRVN
jgi:hypothetical protein